MGASNTPIELRAHHVISGLNILLENPSENRVLLEKAGYDPKFIDFLYTDFKKILSNPDQQFLISVDKPDFICQACMNFSERYKQEKCFASKEERAAHVRRAAYPFLGNAFLDGVENSVRDDSYTIQAYGLKEGQVYTVNELRELVNP